MPVCRGGVSVAFLVYLLGHVQLSLGQGCEWDSSTGEGLEPRSPDNETRHLAHLPDVKDVTGCQRACCARPECQYAVVANPPEGTPECVLLGCIGKTNTCNFQSHGQSTVFRKKVKKSTKVHVEGLNAETPKPEETGIPARCLLPQLTGPCRASFPKFHYDATSESCNMFVYGGCDGNENNFDTQQECEAACSGVKESIPDTKFHGGIKGETTSKPPPSTHSETARCLLPKKTGPCRASFPKFHYDVTSESCKTFVYGGCDGNKNNFETKQECEAACSGVTASSVPEMNTSDLSGRFGGRGQVMRQETQVAPFFLIATLAVISAVLLAAVVLTTLHRSKLRRQPSTISDKVGLLPEEQSSVESLSVEGSPKLGKA